MLLHASHAAQHGHHVDTDVVVLAMSIAQCLHPEYEVCVAFGTGKGFQYLAAHKVSAGLGLEKAQHFRCSMDSQGATLCPVLQVMERRLPGQCGMLPELTEALLKLSSVPEFIPGDVLYTIERFVFLVYDRTSTCTDIDKACTKHDVQLIPPTKAALEEQNI